MTDDESMPLAKKLAEQTMDTVLDLLSPDPEIALMACGSLRMLLPLYANTCAFELWRTTGCTYSELGKVYGVSRQGAFYRFSSAIRHYRDLWEAEAHE